MNGEPFSDDFLFFQTLTNFMTSRGVRARDRRRFRVPRGNDSGNHSSGMHAWYHISPRFRVKNVVMATWMSQFAFAAVFLMLWIIILEQQGHDSAFDWSLVAIFLQVIGDAAWGAAGSCH